MKQWIKRLVPERLWRPGWNAWKQWTNRSNQASALTADQYAELYEHHAQRDPHTDVIGAGDFQRIGELELAVLKQEGLLPQHTVYDLGCGVGRLAIQLVPFLQHGTYWGSDIAPTMLQRAGERLRTQGASSGCQVHWVHQTGYAFPVPPGSVDLLCAFSVFTHMEHEDCYRYLVEARRAVKPGGKLIFSCWPIHLPAAQDIFLIETRYNLQNRWRKIKNVVTTVELIETIARLAQWQVVRWYPGETPSIYLDPQDRRNPLSLGQSVVVLQPAG